MSCDDSLQSAAGASLSAATIGCGGRGRLIVACAGFLLRLRLHTLVVEGQGGRPWAELAACGDALELCRGDEDEPVLLDLIYREILGVVQLFGTEREAEAAQLADANRLAVGQLLAEDIDQAVQDAFDVGGGQSRLLGYSLAEAVEGYRVLCRRLGSREIGRASCRERV